VSALLYPGSLPGLAWDSQRTPIFRTGIQPSLSFKESRLRYALYPVFRFDLQYEFLRDAVTPSDLRALVGLHTAMAGSWDTFLYTDPTYNTVADEPFGTGDGTTTQFQLIATFQNSGGPGGPELIQNLNGAAVIKKAGATQAQPGACSISGTGLVTFVTAPAAAAALTWSGSFYYRCRFSEDQLTTSQFMSRFWSAKQISIQSIKL
jgi:uncharacterized protein (TIGR02217 family)